MLVLSAGRIAGATIEFSALIGGGKEWSRESINDIVIDRQGNIYLAGETQSYDFPATVVYGNKDIGQKCFVVKLSPDGSRIVYATLLAGGAGRALAVDATGNVVVTGETDRADFPVKNAVQSAKARGAANSELGGFDAFVAKLDASGQLVFSTFYGGTDREMGLGIALDGAGDVWVVGLTVSTDLPVSTSAAKTSFAGKEDAFVLKLSGDGSQRLVSSYLCGSGVDNATTVVLAADGKVLVGGLSNSKDFEGGTMRQFGARSGRDAFVARLNPATAAVEHLVYLGGSGTEGVAALTLDRDGNWYLTGVTGSDDFPTTAGSAQSQQASGFESFAAKVNAAGSELIYATYLAGSMTVEPLTWPMIGQGYPKSGLAVDESGRALVVSTLNGDGLVIRLDGDGKRNGVEEWNSKRRVEGTQAGQGGGPGKPGKDGGA